MPHVHRAVSHTWFLKLLWWISKPLICLPDVVVAFFPPHKMANSSVALDYCNLELVFTAVILFKTDAWSRWIHWSPSQCSNMRPLSEDHVRHKTLCTDPLQSDFCVWLLTSDCRCGQEHSSHLYFSTAGFKFCSWGLEDADGTVYGADRSVYELTFSFVLTFVSFWFCVFGFIFNI